MLSIAILSSILAGVYPKITLVSAVGDSIRIDVSSPYTSVYGHHVLEVPPTSDQYSFKSVSRVVTSITSSSSRFTIPRVVANVDLLYHYFAISPNAAVPDDSALTAVSSVAIASDTDTIACKNCFKGMNGAFDENLDTLSGTYGVNIGLVGSPMLTYSGTLNHLCSRTKVSGYDSTIKIDGTTYYCYDDVANTAMLSFNQHLSVFASKGIKVAVGVVFEAKEPSVDTVDDLTPKVVDIGANDYAPDLSTKLRFQKYRASIEYLARKFSPYVKSWTVGNEVNSHKVWHSRGAVSPSVFVAEYEKQLRATYLAIKKYARKAEVYAVFDHCWSLSASFKPADSGLLPAKLTYDLLEKRAAKLGNYDWGVAFHAYAYKQGGIRSAADIWNDAIYGSVNSFSAPGISFRNLGVLQRYLSISSHKVNGSSRRILLTEEGVSAENSAGTETLLADTLQGAAYWYAYQKAKSLSLVRGYIYHQYHATSDEEVALDFSLFNQYGSPRLPLMCAMKCADSTVGACNLHTGTTCADPLKYIANYGRSSVRSWGFVNQENKMPLLEEEITSMNPALY